MATVGDYLQQLRSLLPLGAAWARDEGATLGGVLGAAAVELARVDARALNLMAEADPRATSELLAQWETAFGLPDTCTPASPGVEARRLALHQKVASQGGQSRAYFISLAALLGYQVDITEFRPLRIAFRIPQRLRGRQWAFVWQVNVYGPLPGSDASPFPHESLECVIRRAAPAHTQVTFAYPESDPPSLLFSFI